MSNSMLEMNFTRLLYCTERLAVQKQSGTIYNDYVKVLEIFFNKLLSSSHHPSPENIRKYEIRIKKLKQICDTIQSSNNNNNILHRLSHSDRIVTSSDMNETAPVYYDDVINNDDNVKTAENNNLWCETDNQSLVQGTLMDRCDLIEKERQRINRELREQLLGEGNKSTDYSKNKNLTHSTTTTGLLRQQEIQREQLASEMLLLTTDLKHQSTAMNQRIRQDYETVHVSIEQVERNTNNLHSVLNELSIELGAKCGRIVWILFFISLGLFLYMIIFMKMFRKRIIQSNSVYSSSSTSKTEL
ncbi:unnamed protein product [Schistosoma turkestanicum]|nr:unnamed protein product [Schistosoma turkestanicum]